MIWLIITITLTLLVAISPSHKKLNDNLFIIFMLFILSGIWSMMMFVAGRGTYMELKHMRQQVMQELESPCVPLSKKQGDSLLFNLKLRKAQMARHDWRKIIFSYAIFIPEKVDKIKPILKPGL